MKTLALGEGRERFQFADYDSVPEETKRLETELELAGQARRDMLFHFDQRENEMKQKFEQEKRQLEQEKLQAEEERRQAELREEKMKQEMEQIKSKFRRLT